MTQQTSDQLTPDSNILISGVTGLIGGETLKALSAAMSGGTGHIWALIRPRRGLSPEERLRQRLGQGRTGASKPRRPVALCGDMTLPSWGLSPADHCRVIDSVDIIIHNAADTSFVARRSTAETNLSGARELLSLARQCKRAPLIVFMSTATNCGEVKNKILTEDEGCRPDNTHVNDYTRSKAEAERLIRGSGLKVLTLRPSIVLPANRNAPDLAKQILWFAPITRYFGALPIAPESRLDVVDVDFVVNATVGLLRKAKRSWDTYHVSAGPRHVLTTTDTFEVIDRYYKRDQPLRLVTPDRWTPRQTEEFVRTTLQRQLFAALNHYFPFLNQNVAFDDARLQDELGEQLPRVRRLLADLPRLLSQIPDRVARREAACP